MEKGTAFCLYRDIAERTDGDVYIGVVGPVRTGKSTFIARFMEELVLPIYPCRKPRRVPLEVQAASYFAASVRMPSFSGTSISKPCGCGGQAARWHR